MPSRPYRPSGKTESGAAVPLLAVALAAGVLAGIVEGVVGHFLISLIILFPLLIGLVAGGAASWRVGVAKVRAPVLAAAAGALGGLAGQATTHVMDYQYFRAEVAKQIQSESPGADTALVLDDWLQGETGTAGLPGFLKLQAREGVTIKRGSGKGIELTGTGAYILWIVELLLAAGAAAAMAWGRANKPFCEHCVRWYDLDEEVARGDAGHWKDVVAAVERGDAAGALAARGAPDPKAHASVLVARCSRCTAHEPVLRIVVKTRLDTKKPKESEAYESLVPHAVARALLAAAKAEEESGAGASEASGAA